MPSWNAGGYTMNPVGPQIDPRYPVFRPDNPVAIGTDDSYRDTFAGGVLRGFQNRPRTAPGYASMPGTAEYAAAQGQLPQSMRGLLPGLYNQSQQTNAGLLGNAVIAGGEGVNPFYGSQVVPTNPSGIYTATPTDPNAPPQEEEQPSAPTLYELWQQAQQENRDAGQWSGYQQSSNIEMGIGGAAWDDLPDDAKYEIARRIRLGNKGLGTIDEVMSRLGSAYDAETADAAAKQLYGQATSPGGKWRTARNTDDWK